MATQLQVDRARVELEMVRRGWTQTDLGRIVGVSQGYISQFLCGRKTHRRLAVNIAKAFGLDVADVLRPKGRAA